MAEGIAVFLPVLYSFLNGHWTSACSSDNDCLDGIERCCKVRHSEGKISCVKRVNCGDYCYDRGDCSAPERCDIFNNFCTTACNITVQCHEGYICDEGHCVSAESALSIITLIAVFVGLGALLFLLCCCVRQKRRSRSAFTNRGPMGTIPRQNGEVGTLETRSNLQRDEESAGQILDPIAEGGPPAYNEVSTRPESPPPTYEQVMNASYEILPPNVHEHQV